MVGAEPLCQALPGERNGVDRSHRRQKSWSDDMGQALLVNIDLDTGAEIVRIVDEAGIKLSVAAWIVLDEYGDWRFLMSSRQFDAIGRHKASGLVVGALD